MGWEKLEWSYGGMSSEGAHENKLLQLECLLPVLLRVKEEEQVVRNKICRVEFVTWNGRINVCLEGGEQHDWNGELYQKEMEHHINLRLGGEETQKGRSADCIDKGQTRLSGSPLNSK